MSERRRRRFTNAALWSGAPAPIVRWRAGMGLFQNSNGTTAASANNDPVGYWTDQHGIIHIIQATAGSRPLLQTALPSVKFDGTDDYLAFAGAFANTLGSVYIVFKTGATAFATRGPQVLLSRADEAVTNEWFEIGITSEGRIYIERNAAGTKHTLVGSSFLELSTAYGLYVSFDDIDYYAQVNDVEQNPLTIENIGTPSWFGDVAGADNIVLGGTVTSAGLVRPFQGEVMDPGIYAQDIT